ncbi:type I secretion system permease/ATPase [Pseudomonas sp. MWU13-3659]|uniref:peptidase domain-containing ABC transporter n=1 Tax=Pseudomonas sp. MWU13-3659 TaxID=2986964 RepID=UPI002075C7F3|nr:type I secretion system permease/ATPase [Pseudomonas sp. MWU13-3659]
MGASSARHGASVETALACCHLLVRMQARQQVAAPPAEAGHDLRRAVGSYARRCGVKLRVERLALASLSAGQLPLAMRRRAGDFVVLARLNDRQALLQSPTALTPQVISRERLAEEWTGEVIRLRQARLRFDLSWFLPMLCQHRRLWAEVLALSLLVQVLALAAPLCFQAVMDKVLPHRALATLDVLAVALVAVAVFEVLLKGAREYLAAHTASRVDIGLGLALFRHLMGLPLGYFRQRQVGAVVARLQALGIVREFLTGSLPALAVDVLFTLVFLLVMAWLSPTLALLVVCTLPLYGLLAWAGTGPLQRCIERQFHSAARNTAFLNETVSAGETVKGMAVEPMLQRRWEAQAQCMAEAGQASQRMSNAINQGLVLLQRSTTVLVLCWGAHQVIGLQMTLGQLIAFSMLLTHVSQPLAKLIEVWQQFVQARVALHRLGEVLNLPTEHDGPPGRTLRRLRGEVRIEQLRFRYRPDLPLVLRGLELRIEPGQALGIVGPSGSGKSTLARLLQKLYVPEGGRILLDGQPLETLDSHWLRRRVGVVQQESHLFNLTIRQNIALHHPAVALERVIEVARLAGAHDFILQLPQGYDTPVAEGGRSLSGGQRQRIAIARALLGDPRIIIFDEATSALDDESQAQVRASMARIAEGRTVIVIAHRLSAVRDCQRIAVMEHGCVSECGDHPALLARGGTYARLWHAQQAGGEGLA